MTLPFPTWSLRDEIDPLPLSIGALLVVILVVQLARPEPAPADQSAAHPLRFAPAPLAAATPDYPQILSRPLFSPTRGAAGGAGADQAASTTLSDYTLVGVTIMKGRGEAILRGPAGEVVSLRAGEALLGWRVAQIEQGAIVLQQGDVRRTVAVAGSAAPKPGAQ